MASDASARQRRPRSIGSAAVEGTDEKNARARGPRGRGARTRSKAPRAAPASRADERTHANNSAMMYDGLLPIAHVGGWVR